MSRALALSIALSVLAGPNAPLLCRAWCDHVLPPAAASECHHDASAEAVITAGLHSCPGVATSTGAFVREDSRRAESAPDTVQGLLARHHRPDIIFGLRQRQPARSASEPPGPSGSPSPILRI
jgi:hypothetical protein